MLPQVAADMDEFNKELMRIALKEKGVHLMAGACVNQICEDGLRLTDAQGKEQYIPADTIILAAGLMPNACAAAPEAELAGDSVKPGRIGDATYSGYALARRLFE